MLSAIQAAHGGVRAQPNLSCQSASSATSSTPTSSTVPLVVLAIGLRVVDQLAVLIEVGEAAQIAVLA